MTELLLDKIRVHIKENIISYILLLVFFVLGIIFGGYILNIYSEDEILLLNDFFTEALSVFKGDKPDYNLIFKNTFIESLKMTGFIWILGFTVIGLPIIFLTAAKSGFMLGFTVTFIISAYSYKGILISVILIFVKCFIFIPCVFVISSYAISLSALLTKMLTGKIKYKINLKYSILNYFVIFIASVPVVILYSLMEAYLTANLLSYV